MASLNKVIIAGNLTRNPEVKYLPSGQAVCEIGVAINDNYKSKTGEMVERTVFVDVTVWGKQAETTGQYLQKGSPVLIEGRLNLESWETKEGEKRSKLKVVAERVQFLNSRSGAGSGEGEEGRAGGRSASAKPNSREGASSRTVSSEPPPADDSEDLPF